MIILDASVVIKWFLEEEDSHHALKFKNYLVEGKEIIVVPDLIFYEITNVLRYKKGIKEEVLTTIIPSLFNIGFEIITPSTQLLQESLHLSFVTGLSIYDSIYPALANEVGGILISADKRLFQQAHPFARVKLLS